METIADIAQSSRNHMIASWYAQRDWQPLPIERADGVYLWDADGQRHLDWLSSIFNVNIGHNHPRIIAAIEEQLRKVAFVHPSHTTAVRARLGELLAAITPGDLCKTFLTTGGGEANENAMKIARDYSGRQKIMTRYRSYHGSTAAANSATGGPRRLPGEPGVPWVIHLPDPDAYHSPVYRGRSQEEGDLVVADLIEDTIRYEGADNIAAILWEGYSGASGVIQPTRAFFARLSEICQKYGILYISDEILSGFGRTGTWFGCEHYPELHVDMITFAKGVNSGYLPLGGVIVNEDIADHYERMSLPSGLTNQGQPLACAAAVANIEALQEEGIVARAAHIGEHLHARLQELAERHPIIGDIRGAGLLYCTELVANRETRAPLSPWNAGPSEALAHFTDSIKSAGLHTMVRWNWVFHSPPLTISEAEIDEGINILDAALSEISGYYEG